MTTLTKTETIQQLYLAYFQRPADPMGLQFWSQAIDTVGIASISASFANSTEYRALTEGKSHAEVIDTLYLNIFGQHADPDGLALYKAGLESGKTTVDVIAREILAGAVGGDKEIVNNKQVAAELFTTALGIEPTNLLGYLEFVNRGKELLASVSSDASLYAALGKLPNLLEIVVTASPAAVQSSVPYDFYPSLPLNNEGMVQKLFLAYFDRPASVDELKSWSEALDKTTIAAVSKQLSQLKEYTDSVQGLSQAAQVDKFYMNLFGRNGDAAGMKFYGDLLASGKLTIDQLVPSFFNDAQPNDREVLENRMLGAELFTTALKIEPQLKEIYNSYKLPGRTFLDAITGDASLYQAVRDLPEMLQDLVEMMNTPVGPAQLVGVAAPDQGLFGA